MSRESRFRVQVTKEELAEVLAPLRLPDAYVDMKPAGILLQSIRENQHSEWDQSISIEWIFREE